MGSSNLPFPMSPLDAIALIWFAPAWGGYNLVIHRILVRTGGLNSQMKLIRESRTRQMFARDHRVGDAILLGQLIQSVVVLRLNHHAADRSPGGRAGDRGQRL